MDTTEYKCGLKIQQPKVGLLRLTTMRKTKQLQNNFEGPEYDFLDPQNGHKRHLKNAKKGKCAMCDNPYIQGFAR